MVLYDLGCFYFWGQRCVTALIFFNQCHFVTKMFVSPHHVNQKSSNRGFSYYYLRSYGPLDMTYIYYAFGTNFSKINFQIRVVMYFNCEYYVLLFVFGSSNTASIHLRRTFHVTISDAFWLCCQ